MGRIVIIGGGFIATKVCDYFRNNGVDTLQLTRKNFDFTDKSSSICFRENLRTNDTVYFCAADAPSKTSEQVQRNVSMVENFANGVKDITLHKLVYLSSDAVYSDSRELLTENSLRAPTSLHGVMHLCRETIISQEIKANQKILVRPTLVYGAEDPHNGYGPNKFAREANSRSVIQLIGEGEEMRDHVCVDDLAELMAKFYFFDFNGDINITTGWGYTFLDLAKTIAENIPGTEIKFSERVGAVPHGGFRLFDNRKILNIFPNYKFTRVENYMKENLSRYRTLNG